MGNGPTLLFVDEGPAWLAGLRDALEGGYTIIAVETGPQALACLESRQVDVLVTDNLLASVQDRRFSQTLQQHHTALPRVILAERPELERAIATRNGDRVDAALPKPCSENQLRAVVEQLTGDATVPRAQPASGATTAPPPAKERSERETQPDPFEVASGED